MIDIPNEEKLSLNIDTIKHLKKNLISLLAESIFSISIFAQDSLRRFDDKKYKAILDTSPIYYLHFSSIELYNKLKLMYDKNNKIIIEGIYKSKKTIEVTTILEVM